MSARLRKEECILVKVLKHQNDENLKKSSYCGTERYVSVKNIVDLKYANDVTKVIFFNLK